MKTTPPSVQELMGVNWFVGLPAHHQAGGATAEASPGIPPGVVRNNLPDEWLLSATNNPVCKSRPLYLVPRDVRPGLEELG